MTGHVKVSGAWKQLTGLHAKVGGAWKAVSQGHVKVAGAWKQFYQSFSVTADETTVSSSDSGFAPCGDPGTTNVVAVSTVGGVAPFTYLWTKVGGDADSGPYAPTAPTGASTAFSDVNNNVCTADINSTEVWKCTVTDDDSQQASVNVNVTLTWADLS